MTGLAKYNAVDRKGEIEEVNISKSHCKKKKKLHHFNCITGATQEKQAEVAPWIYYIQVLVHKHSSSNTFNSLPPDTMGPNCVEWNLSQDLLLYNETQSLTIHF